MNCEFCSDRSVGGYPARLCPHIMENITDLLDDDDFCEAVRNAEDCTTRHRKTLIYLKKYAVEKIAIELPGEGLDESVPHCNHKQECQLCRYANHGFICYNEHNKTCLRDWLAQIKKRKGERNHVSIQSRKN